MSNNAVSSVLEKFTALNNEYQEIAEQAKVDLKEYNDYCDSSDNDLSKKMAELREKFARVEAHLEYARAHASDLEEAEMPFKTEWEQLDELHSKINPESTSDVYAETLYTKASGQKLYYESEVERTKKKILGSKVQAKRLYDSQLAELEERKKKVYDEFKEYANSEEFKAYIKGLSKDAAAFNSSGKSNLPVGTEISLGQRTVTTADHDDGLAAEEESVAGGTVRNTAAGVFDFARHPEFAYLRAGGHDYSTGGIRIPTVQHNTLGIALHICADHVVIDDFGAETLSLLAHGIHEIRAHDAVWEPGEVLHFSGIDQLSAGRERPGNDHRTIPGAAKINGRSIAGRPGTDDDHVCCLFTHAS